MIDVSDIKDDVKSNSENQLTDDDSKKTVLPEPIPIR